LLGITVVVVLYVPFFTFAVGTVKSAPALAEPFAKTGGVSPLDELLESGAELLESTTLSSALLELAPSSSALLESVTELLEVPPLGLLLEELLIGARLLEELLLLVPPVPPQATTLPIVTTLKTMARTDLSFLFINLTSNKILNIYKFLF
jgi:hypothetical protein